MKIYFIIGILALLTFSSSTGALLVNKSNSTIISETTANTLSADFTHTVFIEQGTATWCPNCPNAAEALYSIYQSGDYPFYYVALVHDMNPIAKERLRDYVINLYKLIAFPTIYFDGGDINRVGGGSVQSLETEYRRIIEEVGAREVIQPIELDTSVIWLGNAKITITVNITNDGNFYYFGKIRSYVTEIDSRWKDDNGNPYHFGFLDFAIDKPILLPPGVNTTFTVTWDGAMDHNGESFSDILSDNVMVISTVSHWIPHFRTGYQTEEYTQRYLAFYVDQSDSATPP